MLAGQEEEGRPLDKSFGQVIWKQEGNWVKYNFFERLLRLLLETTKIIHTHTVYRQPLRHIKEDHEVLPVLRSLLTDNPPNWPIAVWRVPSSDPRYNCGMHFDSSSVLVSKVAKLRITSKKPHLLDRCQITIERFHMTSWRPYPPSKHFQLWRLRNAIFSTCHEMCLRKIDLES